MIEKTNNLFEDKEIKELKTLLEENQRQLNLLTFDYKENSGDNTNKTQINEQKWLDNVQTVFDWAGLVPVYGDAIDIINALISFTRASVQGKFMPHGLNGIISVIAIIPVVGSVIAIPFKMIFKFIPVASATKIIKELNTTRAAPINVRTLGTSLQIKKPKNIAKTKLKYLIGVTNDASASL